MSGTSRSLILLGAIALLMALSSFMAIAQQNEYHPDQIFVKPKPGVTQQQMDAVHAVQGSTVLYIFTRFDNLQLVKLAPESDVLDSVSAYETNELVEYAEPIYKVSADVMPNDEFFY